MNASGHSRGGAQRPAPEGARRTEGSSIGWAAAWGAAVIAAAGVGVLLSGNDDAWAVFLSPASAVLAISVYLLPTAVAFACGGRLRRTIAVVNLFLGWTLMGWVVAMAAAVPRSDQPHMSPGGHHR